MDTPAPKGVLDLPTCDDRLMWDVWLSIYHLRTVNVADRIGLFPLLHETPLDAQQVSEHLSLGPRATEAMLGILSALGFLTQLDRKFHLTDVSRNFLLPNSPYYWGGALRLTEDLPLTASMLQEALQRDAPTLHWRGNWEVQEEDPDKTKFFTAAMHSHSLPAVLGAARRGDFEGIHRLLDVGGGSGCFCIALAQRYPHLHFTILELPGVCHVAQQYIAEHGLTERIDTSSANMFTDPWPSGHDGVLFMNIFHDWDWDTCVHLGRRSFDALPSGGRIYVHEMLLDDTRDGPLAAISFSMKMAFAEKGKQMTAGELDRLLRECGFGDVQVTRTYGYYSLVTGRKP
jgi:hypothetical protein